MKTSAPPPDWPKLITELKGKGWTQAQIAEACGTTQPLISGLQTASISETRYSIGAALVKLHRKIVVGNRRETDPARA